MSQFYCREDELRKLNKRYAGDTHGSHPAQYTMHYRLDAQTTDYRIQPSSSTLNAGKPYQYPLDADTPYDSTNPLSELIAVNNAHVTEERIAGCFYSSAQPDNVGLRHDV